ncbi:MAG TPA: hypothetical protein VFH80_33685, partial [Solirubrobacteraceae bacterium]|nr:hypothetical protein [Solirubrobacteraceae bacterium]
AGTYAVHAIGKVTDEMHAAALALVDSLINMASPDVLLASLNGRVTPEGHPGSPLSPLGGGA